MHRSKEHTPDFLAIPTGTPRASVLCMAGVKRYQDLLAWQLMHELNLGVYAITRHGPAARDLAFRDGLRDAAESAERNIPEGFGRYHPKEMARFFDIARASALETQALLLKGFKVGYWDERDYRRLHDLADRGIQAIAKFQRYLRSPRAQRNAARRYAPTPANDPNERTPER